MEDWTPTKEDLLKVERLINSHQLEYEDLILQKKTAEVELAKIKNKIRTRGKMPQGQYDSLAQNQDKLNSTVLQIQRLINPIKEKLRQKHLMAEEIRVIIQENDKESDELINKLVALRDKYNEFSSDGTRVGSTRIMASKFVEEINTLIA